MLTNDHVLEQHNNMTLQVGCLSRLNESEFVEIFIRCFAAQQGLKKSKTKQKGLRELISSCKHGHYINEMKKSNVSF